jgi:hypothetical protein
MPELRRRNKWGHSAGSADTITADRPQYACVTDFEVEEAKRRTSLDEYVNLRPITQFDLSKVDDEKGMGRGVSWEGRLGKGTHRWAIGRGGSEDRGRRRGGRSAEAPGIEGVVQGCGRRVGDLRSMRNDSQ